MDLSGIEEIVFAIFDDGVNLRVFRSVLEGVGGNGVGGGQGQDGQKGDEGEDEKGNEKEDEGGNEKDESEKGKEKGKDVEMSGMS